ncbi:Endonuclease/exonuclease/phosphatase [Exophiala viscosa]|uniref:Endonuclease/exonuclease/phosphatase n=1 Tax=Exophiala viscosa TaxID=2486360 RepID=UPI002197630C|nr:Endonuclease/exonuclease/phosphatase [Exophiala viscosa]
MALNLYLLTFNCGRNVVQPDVFAPYLFDALDSGSSSPEFLVLCLQEVAPIGYSFLGGSFLTPYFNAFRHAVKLASKDHSYVNVFTRNVGLTALMVFARDDVADNVTWLQMAGVGLGVSEMGNKGAVGVRLGYKPSDSEEMQLTFVSAHLAPMEDGLDRRNEDYKNIVRRLVFVPDPSRKPVARDEEDEDAPLLQGQIPAHNTSESGIYYNHSHLFFAGDLNYRTSLLRPSPQDVEERFPQPTKNRDDPKNYHNLLAEDQLTEQVKAGKSLHGLTEAPIDFPPTYKYHTDESKPVTLDGGDQEWQWAPHRWPSWCDRIFFWDQGDVEVKPQKYTCLPLFATSDHRPVVLAASVPLKPVAASEQADRAPFQIDSTWKSRRAQARRKELVVGLGAYLALTREGNALLIATVIGAVGGWLIIRSMLMA